MEEIGFNWGEYLEETGTSAAPHASFRHVRTDLPPLRSAREGWGGRRGSKQAEAGPFSRREGEGKRNAAQTS